MPDPLNDRRPGTQSGSQWATDEGAFGTCLVYALLGLSVVGAILGGVFWLLTLLV